MTKPEIDSISPFLIVKDVTAAFAFYCGQLGFEAVERNRCITAWSESPRQ